MSCPDCHYYQQKGYDLGREAIAADAFVQAADYLVNVLNLYDYLWQWGDGYGAWALQVIDEALERHGFERWKPQPRQQSGPRRKPVTTGKVVIAMQRSNGSCVACGTTDRLEVDHIVPISRGGTNDADNLQMLCKSCNASKRDKTMDEWQGGDR